MAAFKEEVKQIGGVLKAHMTTILLWLKRLSALTVILLITVACINMIRDKTKEEEKQLLTDWFSDRITETVGPDATAERKKLIEEIRGRESTKPPISTDHFVFDVLRDFTVAPVGKNASGQDQHDADMILLSKELDEIMDKGKVPEIVESLKQGRRAFLNQASKQLGALVVLGGLVCGLLSALFDWKIREKKEEETGYYGTLASALCGAAAAPIGVFVLANSNPSDWVHCCLFAFICGFSWRGILEQAQTMVRQMSPPPDPFGTSVLTVPLTNPSFSSQQFVTSITEAVDKLKHSFDAAVLLNNSDLKLASKNQSNQIIAAIFVGIKSLDGIDDATVSAAIAGIIDIAVASVPLNDLNILDVAKGKVVGIVNAKNKKEITDKAVADLKRLLDATKDKIPGTKSDFINHRIADISSLTPAT